MQSKQRPQEGTRPSPDPLAPEAVADRLADPLAEEALEGPLHGGVTLRSRSASATTGP